MKKILEHGHCILVDSMGNDLSISRAARVSYDAEGRPEDKKLIEYLWANKHATPFEAVTFTFDIKAPVFVFRQWHRHRTQSYNELSARYRKLPAEMYVPALDQITTQSTDNKQMRTLEQNPHAAVISEIIRQQNASSYHAYEELLALDCPRELARGVLPFNIFSHMQTTINLRNLFAFCTLRDHDHAQHEIRVYAKEMIDLIRPIVPIAVAAWEASHHGN